MTATGAGHGRAKALGSGKNLQSALVMFGAIVLAASAAAVRAEELPKKVPVSVTADKLDYDRVTDVYTAEGNVKIEQQDIRLEADRIVLNNRTGEALAEGNVYLQDKGDVLRADRLQFNVNTRAGVITNGDLFLSKDNYHLKGSTIERRSETVYRVENGTFTTCDEEEWFLEAREIDVDLGRYATGSGVSFNIGGVPVLYTPYLLFPVRRQSGLLIPELGYSSRDGFLMKNAVFWAVSDHQDMTFISDYRAQAGLGTGVEYRYVNSQDSAGRAFANYFDTFDSDMRRWELQYQHREEFTEDLSFRSDVDLVSDEYYFRDLERSLALRSRPYLDSNVFYVERWTTASLYLLGQYTTDLTQQNDLTIQKVPEIRYTIYSEAIAPFLHLNFEGAAANFTAREGDTVRRADFRPELKAALSVSSLSFTPRIGGRATYYDRGATTIEPAERKYYYAGADLNARFSRVYGVDAESGIGRIRHSIEPTISYSYLPRIDEGDTPVLDSTEMAAEENVITVSLINRLTARYRDASGARTFDPLVFLIAQSYDVDQARDPAVTDARPRSELRAELYVKTPTLLTLSANGTYNTYTDRLSSSSESVAVKAHPLTFDITHRYLREPRTAFLVGGIGYTIGKWSLGGQIWQDLELRKTTQQEYKAQYASQCWGLGLSYISKPDEIQYLLLLDLKGLGAVKF